jgi:hypothetical protein
VKKLVLNIEIDEEKKQQQVAAITRKRVFCRVTAKGGKLRKHRRRNREVIMLLSQVKSQMKSYRFGKKLNR